jgi:hypothetical protein
MLIKSLLLLGLAAIGSSFTLPEDTADGVYRAYHNDAGEEVLELLPATALQSRSNPPTVAIDARSLSKQRAAPLSARHEVTWCGCGLSMNTGDTNFATARLQSAVNAGVKVPGPGPGALIAVQNTVIAFLCNWGNTVTATPSDISDGPQAVTEACGLFVPGTLRVPGYIALDYGYMNYFSTLNYCAAAESAPATSC